VWHNASTALRYVLQIQTARNKLIFWSDHENWYPVNATHSKNYLLFSPSPAFGMKMKQGESAITSLKINLPTTISMKRSRWELSIDMVINRGTFKNTQITLFPFLPSYLKQRLVFTVEGSLIEKWLQPVPHEGRRCARAGRRSAAERPYSRNVGHAVRDVCTFGARWRPTLTLFIEFPPVIHPGSTLHFFRRI